MMLLLSKRNSKMKWWQQDASDWLSFAAISFFIFAVLVVLA